MGKPTYCDVELMQEQSARTKIKKCRRARFCQTEGGKIVLTFDFSNNHDQARLDH